MRIDQYVVGYNPNICLLLGLVTSAKYCFHGVVSIKVTCH